MMPTPELKQQAEREKVQDCGYLFAKRLLQNSDMPHRQNIAVINSLGGTGVHKHCEEAVQTADYKAYRDHDPLFPDSAIMTRELFSKQIAQASKEVHAELGTNQEKLIAVQHRANKNGVRFLAPALDAVARGLNATIVFFAAGTAPWHDSFAIYDALAHAMTEHAIVYKAENMWKVIGLVSLADVIISTSLHVRIMAFIHLKPRITFCDNNSKQSRFIEQWETQSSAPCVEDKNTTWTVLEKHYLNNPARNQNDTAKLYKQHVQKYMESFHAYSGLLRPSAQHSKAN
jgi:hypothetical protein